MCIEEDDIVVPLSPAGRRDPSAIGRDRRVRPVDIRVGGDQRLDGAAAEIDPCQPIGSSSFGDCDCPACGADRWSG